MITYGLLVVMLLAAKGGWCQLSPGDLTEAHAHLEGMSNCTQCHDIGQKVPDQKCLDCHHEIEHLMGADRGLHSSKEVREMSCVDCHSEHHGRRFEMIRFDQEGFDHSRAGYLLEGQHAVIDCRECHKPDHIQDTDLRKREETFLGLETTCLDCHEDYHQQTLGNDCLQCHDYNSFEPAPGFDHGQADFSLRGAHVAVDCRECHPVTTRSGRAFQQFADIPSNRCTDCHTDPHLGQLPASCNQCHTESSFGHFTGRERFDHGVTEFELRGRHRAVDCFACHANDANASGVFQDLLGIAERSCVECHSDVHEGRFGNDCQRCHTEESFFELKDMTMFDHDVTAYPLEGQHVDVDCKACHKGRYTEAIDYGQCKNCHEDYHDGEFTSSREDADCRDCHTLEEKFTYTTFGLDEHGATDFPLAGAHMATPCFDCHLDESHWSFRGIGESCIDCHDDVHLGEIDPTYYPESDCTVCHSTERWSDIGFEHDRTGWELSGAHASVDCRACHFEEEGASGGYTQHFADLNSDCIQCHENVHGDQFAVADVTNCTNCHSTESWLPNNFDHNLTDFPLEGRHEEVDCYECHKTTAEVEGRSIVIFKIEKHACIDCHM